MTVTQILHASLLVSDLTRSQQFYEGGLGLVPIERPFTFPGIWYQLGDQQLHLLQCDRMSSELVNPEHWGRNRHLALAVSNLKACRERLESQQYLVQTSASGRKALFTQDPDTNIIELIEVPADLHS